VAKARNARNGLHPALDVTALIARLLCFLNLALGLAVLVCAFMARIVDPIPNWFNARGLRSW
jgi:hypothetical protein